MKMDYIEFFEKLKTKDSRIRYAIVNEQITDDIPDFYRTINPINVEFEYNDGIVKLVPFDKLLSISKEYQYVEGGHIFATCNGEPIYMKNKRVYTCICGRKQIIEEELAISVDSFFEKVNDLI